MIKYITCFLALLGSIQAIQAQVNQTSHYTFPSEKAKHVTLELDGDVEVRERGGSRILIEVHVQVDNGNNGILTNWVKQGRYDVLAETSEDGTVLRVYSRERKVDEKYHQTENLRLKCNERVSYIVYVSQFRFYCFVLFPLKINEL